MRRRGRRRK